MQLSLEKYLDTKEFSRLEAAMGEAKAYYAERRPLQSDATYGVAGSTFRAFRGHTKPSVVFRSWAEDQVNSPGFRRTVRRLRTTADFERFHTKLGASLAQHWKTQCKKELSVAHRLKLIDLMIKWLCSVDLDDPVINQKLLKLSHVPIDSRVFVAIDRIFSGAFVTTGRSMGHIRSEVAYRFWQSLIRLLMAKLKLPPLYFDYFAWNYSRGEDEWRGL